MLYSFNTFYIFIFLYILLILLIFLAHYYLPMILHIHYTWYVIWIIFEIHVIKLSVKIWGYCKHIVKILANQTIVSLLWLVQILNACPEIAPWHCFDFSLKIQMIMYIITVCLQTLTLTLTELLPVTRGCASCPTASVPRTVLRFPATSARRTRTASGYRRWSPSPSTMPSTTTTSICTTRSSEIEETPTAVT